MRGCAISFLMRASVALLDSFLVFLVVPMSTRQLWEEVPLSLSLKVMIEAAETRVCPIVHRSLHNYHQLSDPGCAFAMGTRTVADGKQVRRHFGQEGLDLWEGFRAIAGHDAYAVSRLPSACHQCRSSSRAVVPLQFLAVRACCERKTGRKISWPGAAECERRTVWLSLFQTWSLGTAHRPVCDQTRHSGARPNQSMTLASAA